MWDSTIPRLHRDFRRGGDVQMDFGLTHRSNDYDLSKREFFLNFPIKSRYRQYLQKLKNRLSPCVN